MHSLFAVFVFVTMVKSNDTLRNDIAARILSDIHAHKVVIYSKTYCSHSQKLKKLLTPYPIKDLKIVELDEQKEMEPMQMVLERITGRSTVPQLFIGGDFVGGHDEIRAIEERGDLRRLLKKAQAF